MPPLYPPLTSQLLPLQPTIERDKGLLNMLRNPTIGACFSMGGVSECPLHQLLWIPSILVRQCTLVVPPQPTQPTIYLTKNIKDICHKMWFPKLKTEPLKASNFEETNDALDRLHRIHNALHWMYVAQIQSEALSMKQCSPQCIYTLKERVLWCRFLKYRCLCLQYFHSSLEGMVHQIFSELLFQSWWTLSMVSFLFFLKCCKMYFHQCTCLENYQLTTGLYIIQVLVLLVLISMLCFNWKFL